MFGTASDSAIAIPALLARYADLFDAGAFEEAAGLFDRGCLVVAGWEITGAERIAAMWRSYVRIYDDGTPRTRHLVTNPAIELSPDGRAAHCRSQWTVLQQVPDQTLRLVGTGRYEDDLRFDNGSWHFVRRSYAAVDFWGDAADHLTTSVGEELEHGDL